MNSTYLRTKVMNCGGNIVVKNEQKWHSAAAGNWCVNSERGQSGPISVGIIVAWINTRPHYLAETQKQLSAKANRGAENVRNKAYEFFHRKGLLGEPVQGVHVVVMSEARGGYVEITYDQTLGNVEEIGQKGT